MPDYVNTTITIGGEITTYQLGQIAKELFKIDKHITFGGLLQQIKETREIYYSDPQAEHGEFQELEDYLRSQGIWYDRDSDMNVDPHIAYFRGTNGLDELQIEFYDGGGDIIVSIDHILDARAKIKEKSEKIAVNFGDIRSMVDNGIYGGAPVTTSFVRSITDRMLDALENYAKLSKDLMEDFDEVCSTYDLPELPNIKIIDPTKNKKLTETELEQLRVKGL